jgi:hypothetical protein
MNFHILVVWSIFKRWKYVEYPIGRW